MKALILNSGIGSRMGDLTKDIPKCMLLLANGQTVISRQLHQLQMVRVTQVVVTTGFFHEQIKDHCLSLGLPIEILFVKNDRANETNYIYSIYLAKKHLNCDMIMLHGDLVFDTEVIKNQPMDSMVVSASADIPEKDFKAVLENGKIIKVGVDFFENAVSAQPIYKMQKEFWGKWLDNIVHFCENDKVNVYAEDALNITLTPYDIDDMLCCEIDTKKDLEEVNERLTGTHKIV
ncbi:MAG: NTP transferase domain-containing protein [Defluviitaleaceae bacterium]|nr:NTP transferase domain-containing protein [Defluviitaleaceae bacterium]